MSHSRAWRRRRAPGQLLRLPQPRASHAADGGVGLRGGHRHSFPGCEGAGLLRAHRREREPHRRYHRTDPELCSSRSGRAEVAQEAAGRCGRGAKLADLLEGIAGQAGVEVQCQIDQRIPPLNADEVRLRQILLNLLSNAIKFTPRGGTVTISAGQVGTDCMIRVADTGIGISAEDLPRIVLPFAQVENAQTGKRRGTGLGLPLSKGLVEQHGGTLTLASEPGVGTTVTVRLPGLAVLDQQSGTGSERSTSGRRAELAKIGS